MGNCDCNHKQPHINILHKCQFRAGHTQNTHTHDTRTHTKTDTQTSAPYTHTTHTHKHNSNIRKRYCNKIYVKTTKISEL